MSTVAVCVFVLVFVLVLVLVFVLVICTSGGPASDPGRLSSSDVIVHVTVLASNNPYGVYVFANGSQHVSIAEDFNSQSANTAASLLVEKTYGAPDYAQVITYRYYYYCYQINQSNQTLL